MRFLENKEPSQTEMQVVADALHTPSVRSYLIYQARSALLEIAAGEPALNEAPESYLRRLAAVRGRLEVLESLLEIASYATSVSASSAS